MLLPEACGRPGEPPSDATAERGASTTAPPPAACGKLASAPHPMSGPGPSNTCASAATGMPRFAALRVTWTTPRPSGIPPPRHRVIVCHGPPLAASRIKNGSPLIPDKERPFVREAASGSCQEKAARCDGPAASRTPSDAELTGISSLLYSPAFTRGSDSTSMGSIPISRSHPQTRGPG